MGGEESDRGKGRTGRAEQPSIGEQEHLNIDIVLRLHLALRITEFSTLIATYST